MLTFRWGQPASQQRPTLPSQESLANRRNPVVHSELPGRRRHDIHPRNQWSAGNRIIGPRRPRMIGAAGVRPRPRWSTRPHETPGIRELPADKLDQSLLGGAVTTLDPFSRYLRARGMIASAAKGCVRPGISMPAVRVKPDFDPAWRAAFLHRDPSSGGRSRT